ncbi:hypothetical protein DFJ73DRAFT_800983 [Zopfochytrium polystomum]|nr:hypothetical protein DFJ73DRAFT_800983 [Zopfochytrium polystomum]
MPSTLAGAAAVLVVVVVAIVALAAESPAARARAQRVNPVSGSVALAVTNFPSSGEFCVGDSIAYAITLDNSVSTTTTDRPFSATSAPPASSRSTTSDSSSSLASIVPLAAASSGLSTGAIAVIAAAGVALLLCVVAALLLAIYRKRRRQKRLDTTTAPSAPPRYSSSGNDVDCSETVSPSVQISRPSMTHTDLSSTTLDELGSGISSSDPPHEPQKQSLFTVAQGLGVPSMAWRSSQQIEYMIPLSRASNSSTADSAAPSAEPTESTQPTLFTGVLQVVTSLEGAVDKPHKPSPSPDPTKKPLLAHRSWTVQQVADALEAEGVAESIVEQFVSDGVDGARLETVDSGFLLREFGVATAGMRARVMGAVRRVRGEEEPGVGVEDGPTGGAGAEVASPPPYLAMDT